MINSLDSRMEAESVSPNILKVIAGFFLYHAWPRKKIVFIASSMRSGSTLLKALLGHAHDVSHLSETRFPRTKLSPRSEKYFQYYTVFTMSRSPIIVLKFPSWFADATTYPYLPNLPVRVIVLLRNPERVLASLEKWTHIIENDFGEKSRSDYQQYIFEVTRSLARLYFGEHGYPVHLVSYEELVSEPKKVTQKLFRFICSSEREGFDCYSQGGARWEWGVDDGSPKIRTGRVIADTPAVAINAEKLLKLAESSGTSEEFFRQVSELA
jgi:hypothetical protein